MSRYISQFLRRDKRRSSCDKTIGATGDSMMNEGRETWPEYPVNDRYIKARRILRYLEGEFGEGRYEVRAQADQYFIRTPTKLTLKQENEIKALSARYSARSSRKKISTSVGNPTDSTNTNQLVPAPRDPVLADQTVGGLADAPSENASSTMGQSTPETTKASTQNVTQESA